MALKAGSRLGAYEIGGLLGAGGMGEVYRARDTRLKREVALKILPESFAADPDRRARFQREAEVLASLNHPNIAAIYGVEERALVLGLVEGETLADRIARGPISVDEALPIARQIAEALEAAHEQGIIHPDLKPANIKVRPDGTVKLLDFGLAKLAGPAESGPAQAGHYVPCDRSVPSDRSVRLPRPANASRGGQADLTASPTMTSPPMLTGAGMILGTAAYMAPEQARGRPADKRSDIWAFGCVLYEMLTGTRAFAGEDVADVMVAVLSKDPDWTALLPSTPAAVHRLLRRALERDRRRRLADIADARLELEESNTVPIAPLLPARNHNAGWRRLLSIGPTAAAAALGAVLLIGTAAWVAWRQESAFDQRVARLTMVLPAGDEVADPIPALSISSSGTHVVYVATRADRLQLYVRAVDSLEATALQGTEGAAAPFFSPNGQWVGFFAQGKLKKISIAAATVQALADATLGVGASWGLDDNIYFAASNISGLFRVPADGGASTAVTRLDRAKGEVSHRWPQILPDGRSLMFTVWTGPGRDESEVHVQRLDTGERTRVVQGGTAGRYLPTGHVAYVRAGQLLAIPVDLEQLDGSNQPVRLDEGIRVTGEGAAQYAVSDAGRLVYLPVRAGGFERRLVWVDRDGRVEPLAAPPREYYGNVAISPDGRRAALDIEAGTIGIWTYDFSRGTLTPLTTGSGSSQAPRWTPDGRRIVYRGTRTGFRNMWSKAVDEASPEERLTTGDAIDTPESFSGDGQWLFFTRSDPATGLDLWALPATGDPKPSPVVNTRADQGNAQLSPDGRWLLSTSDESGREEVFVQPFPGAGARVQVSVDGGAEPSWSRDGRELFYRSAASMMAVAITTVLAVKTGTPRILFEDRYLRSPNGVVAYAMGADGRFLMVEPLQPDPPADQIHVVLNWFEALRRRFPN